MPDVAAPSAAPPGHSRAVARPARPWAGGWLVSLGEQARARGAQWRETLAFLGQVVQSLGRLFTGRAQWRGTDLMWQLDQAGPRSVPIVSLVSGLVGLILAYMGALQLKRFGAQVYIADLVTIGGVREVAALMTGVILSGRIGAAYAAQIGSMQANEEIDALRVMGVSPIDYLVLPRLMAMVLLAPFLTAYAAAVSVLAGGVVAVAVFGVEPLAYLVKSQGALTMAHLSVGLFKGTVYSALVALAGCLQGLRAGRSAQAVGLATTAAVVQAIVWIVVAASVLTIALQRLNW